MEVPLVLSGVYGTDDFWHELAELFVEQYGINPFTTLKTP